MLTYRVSRTGWFIWSFAGAKIGMTGGFAFILTRVGIHSRWGAGLDPSVRWDEREWRVVAALSGLALNIQFFHEGGVFLDEAEAVFGFFAHEDVDELFGGHFGFVELV